MKKWKYTTHTTKRAHAVNGELILTYNFTQKFDILLHVNETLKKNIEIASLKLCKHMKFVKQFITDGNQTKTII